MRCRNGQHARIDRSRMSVTAYFAGGLQVSGTPGCRLGYVLSISGVVSVLAAAAPSALCTQQIDFFEGEFAAGSFVVESVLYGSASSFTTTQRVASGGAPGAFLSVTNTVAGAPFPPGCSVNTLITFVLFPGATVDPGAVGGIESVDLTMQSAGITSSVITQQQGQGVALRQDGVLFVGGQFVTPDSSTWVQWDVAGLAEEDFVALTDQPNCGPVPGFSPDFSAVGGPIEFGFARVNNVVVDASSTVGADSWELTVHTLAPVCPTDLDSDGTTDLADLLQLLAAFGSSGNGDVNGDGQTQLNDLLAVLAAFGQPCT